jgi:hypothetical protein
MVPLPHGLDHAIEAESLQRIEPADGAKVPHLGYAASRGESNDDRTVLLVLMAAAAGRASGYHP